MKLQTILRNFQKLHPKEIDLSLNRIKELCKKLGNPQDKIKALSVLPILCVYWFNAQNTNAQQEELTVYQVGVAEVDVTPDFPIRLRGYSGRVTESTGIVQRLWAKALMIQSS